jgi:hypothetical protein
MVRHTNRRWLCLVTALLFAISSTAHAYAMTDAAMKMPSVAMESSAPDHGMDCGGPDKAAQAACMAICAMAVAILSAPVAISFVVAMQDIVAAPELRPTSASPSPEPHPPKTLNAVKRLAHRI